MQTVNFHEYQSTSGNHGNGCEVFIEFTFDMEGIVLVMGLLDVVRTRIKVPNAKGNWNRAFQTIMRY